jgi:hypothetical protein
MTSLARNSIRISAFALALALPAWAADVTLKLDAGSGFVIQNSASAPRLRVDETTGNVSRNGALFVHTTGTTNLFVGPGAGNLGTSGYGNNTGVGSQALAANTTGFHNSAFGEDALIANTSGAYNSAFGKDALRTNTTSNSNSAFGYAALRANTGTSNSAFGSIALRNNSSASASNNSAFGRGALYANTSGFSNSAFGSSALYSNTGGLGNTAVGSFTLRFNTGGDSNSAVGQAALDSNTTGNSNTAVGASALGAITTGSSNIGIGVSAGSAQTTGSTNIYLDNPGVAGESGTIRIGNGGHTQTFIRGIHNATSTSSLAVLVNATGKLGTTTSSIRFKEDVRDMGAASQKLSRLRPVVFRYRAHDGEPASGVDEYGLIAEEVAEVAPELVVNDEEGRPYSVRYHVLPAMLLNEMQAQQREIEMQRHEMQVREVEHAEEIAALTARLASLEAHRLESLGEVR